MPMGAVPRTNKEIPVYWLASTQLIESPTPTPHPEASLFETPSPKGPLRAAFPAKVHDFYFPKLFLDLPVKG